MSHKNGKTQKQIALIFGGLGALGLIWMGDMALGSGMLGMVMGYAYGTRKD